MDLEAQPLEVRAGGRIEKKKMDLTSPSLGKKRLPLRRL